MGRQKKLHIDEVIQALIDAHGLVTHAADSLNVDYKTIRRYIEESDKAQTIIKAQQHKRSDMAKFKLDEAIMRGEQWAVTFALKNKVDPDGEMIGEANRVEINQTGKIEIAIKGYDDIPED